MNRKVYVDSCVLILALRQDDEAAAARAIAEITKDGVEYIFSPLVELEVRPQPMRHNKGQLAFYDEWFQSATRIWYSEEVHAIAMDQSSTYSIQPLDAAHVATAIVAGADELLTAEKRTKPMFNSRDISVRSIRED